MGSPYHYASKSLDKNYCNVSPLKNNSFHSLELANYNFKGDSYQYRKYRDKLSSNDYLGG